MPLYFGLLKEDAEPPCCLHPCRPKRPRRLCLHVHYFDVPTHPHPIDGCLRRRLKSCRFPGRARSTQTCHILRWIRRLRSCPAHRATSEKCEFQTFSRPCRAFTRRPLHLSNGLARQCLRCYRIRMRAFIHPRAILLRDSLRRVLCKALKASQSTI